jgi:hypothetical protein
VRLLSAIPKPSLEKRPMKKIRLDPEALEVLSFTVADDAAERDGTVYANGASLASCQLAASCIGPCRPNTYEGC